MKKTIDFNFPIEIVKAYEEGKKDEQEDTSKWIVEGLASTSDFDLSGDIIESDAYKDAEKDLSENSTVLENHDPNKRIGRVVSCKAQDEGLWVKVLISKTAKDVWQQIREGVLNKFSIRGRIIDAVKKYVKELGRIANIIKKMYLMECSLVSLPANPQAKTMRWYISKSISDFEKRGGEIPLETEKKGEDMNLDTIASTLESMKDRLSTEDQNTISEMAESLKAKKEKYPDGYPYPKKKDESDEEYEKRLAKDFDEFFAARKKKEEEEEVEKARKKKEEEEEVEKARKKKEEEEEAEKAKKGKEKYPYGYPYPKKKDGGNYSQDEIDNILGDFRASIETYFEDRLTKKDKALMSTKDELMEKLNAVEKENESLKADGKVEEEWSKISDSYKEEDAIAIKGILRKTFLGQALKPEEQSMLIEKKLSSDLMVGGGAPPEGKFDLTPEREKDIIKFSGIKTRIKEVTE